MRCATTGSEQAIEEGQDRQAAINGAEARAETTERADCHRRRAGGLMGARESFMRAASAMRSQKPTIAAARAR